jgi:hypothetical protein
MGGAWHLTGLIVTESSVRRAPSVHRSNRREVPLAAGRLQAGLKGRCHEIEICLNRLLHSDIKKITMGKCHKIFPALLFHQSNFSRSSDSETKITKLILSMDLNRRDVQV